MDRLTSNNNATTPTVTITLLSITTMSNSTKAVRFPSVLEELEEVICDSPLIMTSISDCWYLSTEFVLIKKRARMIAKESRRFGYSTGLDETFSMPLQVADAAANEEETTAEETTSVSSNHHHAVQSKLNLWCKHGHSRRGLEESSNRSHRAARSRAKSEARNVVLNAQREMMATTTGGGSGVNGTILSLISQRLSQNARTFAHMMGLADEFAAQSDNPEGFLDDITAHAARENSQLTFDLRSFPRPFHREAIGEALRMRDEGGLASVVEEGVEHQQSQPQPSTSYSSTKREETEYNQQTSVTPL